jgi:hypothetical protein
MTSHAIWGFLCASTGRLVDMTITLAIALIVALDVALLAGLAYVMSHARKLTPHEPGVTGNAWRLPRRRHRRNASARAHEERVSARLQTALD